MELAGIGDAGYNGRQIISKRREGDVEFVALAHRSSWQSR
jgi:hypothetical protein